MLKLTPLSFLIKQHTGSGTSFLIFSLGKQLISLAIGIGVKLLKNSLIEKQVISLGYLIDDNPLLQLDVKDFDEIGLQNRSSPYV